MVKGKGRKDSRHLFLKPWAKELSPPSQQLTINNYHFWTINPPKYRTLNVRPQHSISIIYHIPKSKPLGFVLFTTNLNIFIKFRLLHQVPKALEIVSMRL